MNAQDEEEDGPPRRPVLPLPDKPALPSALKSRPPTTSLLPPTSASRAAQGPRKRVQWASEVASVALIENRPQLAEMWDTGPDAAEMPSQLLTPSPTPVRCAQGASSDLVGGTTCIAFSAAMCCSSWFFSLLAALCVGCRVAVLTTVFRRCLVCNARLYFVLFLLCSVHWTRVGCVHFVGA